MGIAFRLAAVAAIGALGCLSPAAGHAQAGQPVPPAPSPQGEPAAPPGTLVLPVPPALEGVPMGRDCAHEERGIGV
jgi:hypothetical protein